MSGTTNIGQAPAPVGEAARSLLEAALDLAAQGIPVFPLQSNKRPLPGSAGFKDATTDEATIRTMFSDPLAALIGVPTGETNGFLALDVDPDGVGWYQENVYRMPATRVHRTRRGAHYLFKHRPGVRCSAGKIAKGVDIRGDGGFIVWWPAAGLEVVNAPVADLPDFLYDLILKAQHGLAGESKPPQNPKALAPISAGHLLSLLNEMPNPADTSRDDYLSVMLGTQGAIRGGLALGVVTDEEAEHAKDAAAGWAARWDSPNASDYETEREKFETDFGRRENDIAGWSTLLTVARRLSVDMLPYTEAMADRDLGKLPDEPGDLLDIAKQQAAARSLGSVEGWLTRHIPEPDRLLGDVLTTTSRVIIAGKTGLGKTQVSLGIAMGVASGTGFLHWKSARPARVLVLDGEMAESVLQGRIRDAAGRLPEGVDLPGGNLTIHNTDTMDALRKAAPSLPPFAPLNTEGGRAFVLALIKFYGGFDLIIFDNIMSLTAGDQKDEEVWTNTTPLVQRLTNMGVGQVWIDHTGHNNNDRPYGSVTKSWRMDAVMMLTEPKVKAAEGTTSFDLKFIKSRMRSPKNWAQFADMSVQLGAGGWTYKSLNGQGGVEAEKDKLKAATRAQYDALLDVLETTNPRSATVTREAWYAECVRTGLDAGVPAGASGDERSRIKNKFRTRQGELVAAKWIQVDGDLVGDLRGAVTPKSMTAGDLNALFD